MRIKTLLTIFLLLTISFGMTSCSRKSVPAVGAEKMLDSGISRDKHPLRIIPKKMQNY